MIREVGTLVRLSTIVRDLSGAVTNTPTLTLSVTKPDGSSAAPSVTNSNSGGVYYADYTLDMAGVHVYTWTASAGVVDVQTDQVSAVAAGRALVCSLEEMRLRLRRTDTSDDTSIREHLVSATDWVEWKLNGPLQVTTFTEWVCVRNRMIVLSHGPIQSVVSLTPDLATALDSSLYVLDTVADVIRIRWGGSVGWYQAVYRAGYQVVPVAAKRAGIELARHLWSVENGSAGRAYPNEDVVDTPLGFAVPRRVDEMMSIYAVPGMA